jgi:hypothetical protein
MIKNIKHINLIIFIFIIKMLNQRKNVTIFLPNHYNYF